MCFRPLLLGYAMAAACGIGASTEFGWLAGALVVWIGGAVLSLIAAYLWFIFEPREAQQTPIAVPAASDRHVGTRSWATTRP